MAKKLKSGIKKGTAYPLGISKTEKGIQFAVYAPASREVVLKLYAAGKKTAEYTVELGKEYKVANVFSVMIEDLDLEGMEYTFQIGNHELADTYAKKVTGMEKWGIRSKREEELGVRSVVSFSNSAKKQEEDTEWKAIWGADENPRLPYCDVILYQMHVRGFTKHSTSKVEERGTFKGIERKIPYLKELGVTSLLLLPAYEFEEQIKEEDLSDITKMHLEKYKDVKTDSEELVGAINIDAFVKGEDAEEFLDKKVNYWGYSEEAWYFAPKTSYAYDKKNPEKEFKELVAALHKEGMELLMDMHFTKDTNPTIIMDCLRHWILEYHVDGFRINDYVVPSYMAANDPVVGSVKLLADRWKEEQISKDMLEKNLAEINDGFMNNARRFLKGDEGQVPEFFHHIKRNPEKTAVINYIACNNGFTLQDLVSYDTKHNEANGENGRDGNDFNYSWNCGAEGRTRKKNILELRKKQIKNALLMLFLSQGTPMLLAGDEFGDSREGNNNPYCQDNEISWMNWSLEKKNEEQLTFVKELIAFRKAHRIFHMPKELRATDYATVGYPDISFHGTMAWYLDEAYHNRMGAVMLAGKYAAVTGNNYGEDTSGKLVEKEDDTFYIAYNMHWEEAEFNLPKLLGEEVWEVIMDTGKEEANTTFLEGIYTERNYSLQPRSVVVMAARKKPQAEEEQPVEEVKLSEEIAEADNPKTKKKEEVAQTNKKTGNKKEKDK